MVKQHDVKATRTISGNTYYVRPFGAFTAANLTGELSAVIAPLVGTAAFLMDSSSSAFDLNIEKAMPALVSGFSSLSGDKTERLMKLLLVEHGNISVDVEGKRETQLLTEDLADDLFCGEIDGMMILVFEVIKANYSGFFERAAQMLSGSRIENLVMTMASRSTEDSTSTSSLT